MAAAAAVAISGMAFQASAQNSSPIKLRRVVIDPGHGGNDAGCTSLDGKTMEKDIVLDIATRFSNKIKAAFSDVTPILTRDKDYFVTLQGRADIANKNNADLFVSIHVNSVEGKRTGPNGYSIHTLGQYTSKKKDLYEGNMNVVQRENSVILLEDDYNTRYEGFDPSDPESYIFMNLMQNAFLVQSLRFAQIIDENMKGGVIKNSRGISQDPFYVLWKTGMPAVLVECGFMSNPDDRKSLATVSGREAIADELFRAFVKYKREYDGGEPLKLDGPEAGDKPSETNDARDEASAVLYGTQVLVSSVSKSETDSFFRGFDCKKYVSGRMFKYIIGISSDEAEARENFRKAKKDFKDSFFVKIEGNEILRLN